MAQLPFQSDWTFSLLQQYEVAIAEAADFFALDAYPNQIEIVSSEQMLDAYAAIGMPVFYSHWSFGKKFVSVAERYQRGQMGLAYELVINSNPCIAYLLEENPLTMQVLVMAHASYGHNNFFKNNYLFKTWTNADGIVDYLVFSRDYIRHCEEKYGLEAVESLLDAAHALMDYGVDRYRRPSPLSAAKEHERQVHLAKAAQAQVNPLWEHFAKDKKAEAALAATPEFFPEDQENLLYFLEKNAPLLKPWQREILRIVRKLAQYFYPQRQTKVMNEGWATFWHYHLLYHLYNQGQLAEGLMLEFLDAHCQVVFQPTFDSPYYQGINPYALGFAMFSDLKRLSEQPTAEDAAYFPHLVGRPWRENLRFAMENFKDESFIYQYLSPKVIRDFRLFGVLDVASDPAVEISAIHNDHGYQKVREVLSAQYAAFHYQPNIQVHGVRWQSDRSLLLRHHRYENRPLAPSQKVLQHLHALWGFPIVLESVNSQGEVLQSQRFPL